MQRISLNLPDDAAAALNEMCESTGMTMTAVISSALKTHHYLRHCQASGEQVMVRDPHNVLRQIVLL
jgi:predicted transcriptional regulator